MAKRIAEKGSEYQGVRDEVMEVANESNCQPSEIRYSKEYPDYELIDW